MHMKKTILAAFPSPFWMVLLCLGAISCQKPAEPKPPFNLQLLESSGKIELPNVYPENWLMAHIDVETTGLLPGYHEMIDIGIVMTELSGKVVDSLFLRIKPLHPQLVSPIAKEINAFDPVKWDEYGALEATKAVDSIRSFHKRVAKDKNVLMVAYNSHFDAAFIDHLFRNAGKSWRELYFYFILDIPSMLWAHGHTDLIGKSFMETYNISDEPHIAEQHTGISGAMKNVRIYQKLMNEGSIRP